MNKKRIIGLIAAAGIVGISFFLPEFGGLSTEALRAIALLAAGMVCLVLEPFPVSITAVLLLVLQPIMGIMGFGDSLKNFMSTLFLFLLACYGISLALLNSSLPYRLAGFLISCTKGHPLGLVGAFMLSTALVSSVVSNVPCAVIMTQIAANMLGAINEKPGESRLGRAVMLAVPFGAVFGGMMTPAGSSINVLTLSLVMEATGETISFVKWMAVGIPLALVLVAVATLLLVLIFRPGQISEEQKLTAMQQVRQEQKLGSCDIKILIILTVTLTLWILTSWVPGLDVTIISVFALVALFAPGIDLLKWNEVAGNMGWESILLTGGMLSLGAALLQTGLTDWIIGNLSGAFTGIGVVGFVILIAAVVNWSHVLIPTATAIATLYAAAFAGVGVSLGFPPAMVAFTVATMSSCVLLLPFDPVVIAPYEKKYFTIGQLFVSGTIVTTVWILILGVWMPLVF